MLRLLSPPLHPPHRLPSNKLEGRRKKEEGRRKKEEGRRKVGNYKIFFKADRNA
ncbi:MULTISPECIES: hypothetical protein [unclassified Microcoleus]|uniref:hypothetical protein n=1 Tax=unclassified Microcoleus TaxID=2642155 RepID=UPI001D6242C2|nr:MULTISPECIES: hypothetical protein [unclassified Microcoleus]MCC3501627.1 hypothetical protein [Microcoleus sp. PH2017_19_SFW_U_A]MCC3446490.1 hypothetical protein [Microcoleus sp. PH2017_09_SFU_O_A]MCC3490077.1 hypothetical protein [Microcoleus sp. PH2017_16_JOR_D_A]MCC3499772.1 hypothetical protein [Microcoleus sp. PH2017_15_JOR_U_A]MCC3520475.1 hypothetical protein [Microcoleus sp. PH2017_20_SFW_D_A]